MNSFTITIFLVSIIQQIFKVLTSYNLDKYLNPLLYKLMMKTHILKLQSYKAKIQLLNY